MKRALTLFLGLASLVTLGSLFLSTTFSPSAYAADETIASRTAEIDGLNLHYLTAGHGPSLILLHGYA